MSIATESGKVILSDNIYKDAIRSIYGVNMGNVNLMKEYNRYAVLRVLEWNESNDYFTNEQVACLENVVNLKLS